MQDTPHIQDIFLERYYLCECPICGETFHITPQQLFQQAEVHLRGIHLKCYVCEGTFFIGMDLLRSLDPNRCHPLPDPLPSEYPWVSPRAKDLVAKDFNAIWESIKSWDINVPEAYQGYCGATGNHVMHILFALGLRSIQDYVLPRRT